MRTVFVSIVTTKCADMRPWPCRDTATRVVSTFARSLLQWPRLTLRCLGVLSKFIVMTQINENLGQGGRCVCCCYFYLRLRRESRISRPSNSHGFAWTPY